MSDQSEQCLLAALAGEQPERPDWFEAALRVPGETIPVTYDGAALEVLAWGDRSLPGLLLLHGNRAHAHWWTPVAALLADRFRVAALSFSGMGGSDWRKAYSIEGFADEAMVAAEAGGLFENGKPVFAAHSFGGGPLLTAAELHGEQLAGAIIIDSMITEDRDRPNIPPGRQHKVYPTLAEALARYRLVPPQDCDNLWYIDWIARHSLREVVASEPGGPGWTWRFDPAQWENLTWYDRWHAASQTNCPMAVIDGGRSQVGPTRTDALRAQMPPGTSFEVITGAAHHVMLDKPRELADAIVRNAGEWTA